MQNASAEVVLPPQNIYTIHIILLASTLCLPLGWISLYHHRSFWILIPTTLMNIVGIVCLFLLKGDINVNKWFYILLIPFHYIGILINVLLNDLLIGDWYHARRFTMAWDPATEEQTMNWNPATVRRLRQQDPRQNIELSRTSSLIESLESSTS